MPRIPSYEASSDLATTDTSFGPVNKTAIADPVYSGIPTTWVGGIGTKPLLNEIRGTESNDNYLLGTTDDDYIVGLGGHDNLYGRAGNDILDGGPGNDVMAGGIGDDTYHVDSRYDVVWEMGGEGIDTVVVEAEMAISLPVAVENARVLEAVTAAVYGNELPNTIIGGELADLLSGGAGDDTLSGEGGKDHIMGRAGRDVLSGGPRADDFMFLHISDVGTTLATMDVITDFDASEGDRIDLSYVDANVYAAGNQDFRFIGQSAFSGTPGEINYYHSGGNTIIQMQTGTGTDIEGGIVLQGIHNPQPSWFVL